MQTVQKKGTGVALQAPFRKEAKPGDMKERAYVFPAKMTAKSNNPSTRPWAVLPSVRPEAP